MSCNCHIWWLTEGGLVLSHHLSSEAAAKQEISGVDPAGDRLAAGGHSSATFLQLWLCGGRATQPGLELWVVMPEVAEQDHSGKSQLQDRKY